MKTLLKVLTFVTISVRVSQYVLGSFDFGGNELKSMVLVVTALSLLYYFLKPVLIVIGLPHEGLSFTFLVLLMTSLVLYVLTLFVEDFYIKETTLRGLNIFGFVLPSKDLTSTWSGVFSALVISLVYTYFDWLSSRK